MRCEVCMCEVCVYCRPVLKVVMDPEYTEHDTL